MNKQHDISEEIYHRIYRLIKRGLNPHTIAATLHLPLRTVLSMMNRLERKELFENRPEGSGGDDAHHSTADQEFLDIYFYPKTRYAILDLVGALSDTYVELLRTEIEKVLASSWKAVAIRMSDVSSISAGAGEILLSSKEKFSALGRYFALLDPSPQVEAILTDNKIETVIPVFGTERAFEDAAFSKKGKLFARRGPQNPS